MGITSAHKQVVNVYIFYEIILWSYTKKLILWCSSLHIDNKKKDIVILGKSPTDGLDNTTLTAE